MMTAIDSPIKSDGFTKAEPEFFGATIVSLPPRPDEQGTNDSTKGIKGSNPPRSDNKKKKKRRQSWVNLDVTPLKNLSQACHVKEKYKLLRDMCSPEKLGQSKAKQQPQEEEQEEEAPSLLTPRSRKEDIEIVYERFEVLLNLLREERVREKQASDAEIRSLTAKLAQLEKQTEDDSSTVQSATKKRRSLGTVINILQRDEESNALVTDQEYQNPCVDSLSAQQLITTESRLVFAEKDQKILAGCFEQSENATAGNLDYLLALKEQNDQLSIQVEQLQEQLKRVKKECVQQDVHTNKKSDLSTTKQNLTATQGISLEEKMNRQEYELHERLKNLQCELRGSKRNHSDVLMKLAVESTCRASLAMKLDAALAQIEKQKVAISLLQQDLGQAKYECEVMSCEIMLSK